jgi:hypothetical protein
LGVACAEQTAADKSRTNPVERLLSFGYILSR